jgi:hypothetical protein
MPGKHEGLQGKPAAAMAEVERFVVQVEGKSEIMARVLPADLIATGACAGYTRAAGFVGESQTAI